MIIRDNSKTFHSEDGSHYYWPDGRPAHSMPYKDKKKAAAGLMRKTTLTHAKELGLYPSVTTLLKVIDRPGLNAWRCQMAVLAALTLPRLKDESEEAFAVRVAKDSDTIRDTAADFGQSIHAESAKHAKAFFTGDWRICTDSNLVPFMVHFEGWFKANIERVISVEQVVVNHSLGYAGTRDLKAIHKKHGLVSVDWKTQGVKPGNKLTFYPEWTDQLALYGMADPEPTKLLSVAINSKTPDPLLEKLWTEEEQRSSEEAGALIARLWQVRKKYTPPFNHPDRKLALHQEMIRLAMC